MLKVAAPLSRALSEDLLHVFVSGGIEELTIRETTKSFGCYKFLVSWAQQQSNIPKGFPMEDSVI